MRKIKLYPAPHVEIRLHVSDKMEADFKRCKELAALPGAGMDCKSCSWNEVEFEDIGFCEMPIARERLMEEKNES